MKKFENASVAEIFATYPAELRKRLRAVRRIIFDVAAKTRGVGTLQETLKWGEPAYVTAESGSGSTIRIDRYKKRDDEYAIYCHCQTTLVDTFRTLFPDTLRFVGNRSIVFHTSEPIPEKELRLCIEMALTYHRNKSRNLSLASKRRNTKIG